jgi:hypothetical protein
MAALAVQNTGNNMKTILFLFVTAFISHNAMAADCSALAGTWSLAEDSGETNVISIANTCSTKILSAASRHADENLDFDFIFKTGAQWRIQYRFKAGSLGPDGKPVPNPLPAEIAKEMQGNLTQNSDGSISFGFDALDQMCSKQHVSCPSGKFYRK